MAKILVVDDDARNLRLAAAVLARLLAELHGGTLEVASEPGKGSTFTLRFPMEKKA